MKIVLEPTPSSLHRGFIDEAHLASAFRHGRVFMYAAGDHKGQPVTYNDLPPGTVALLIVPERTRRSVKISLLVEVTKPAARSAARSNVGAARSAAEPAASEPAARSAAEPAAEPIVKRRIVYKPACPYCAGSGQQCPRCTAARTSDASRSAAGKANNNESNKPKHDDITEQLNEQLASKSARKRIEAHRALRTLEIAAQLKRGDITAAEALSAYRALNKVVDDELSVL